MLDFSQVAARMVQYASKTSEREYDPEASTNLLNEQLLYHFESPDYPTQVETVSKIILSCIAEMWKMRPDAEIFKILQDEAHDEAKEIVEVGTYEPVFYISTVLTSMRFAYAVNHLKAMHLIIHFCVFQLRGFNLKPVDITKLMILICDSFENDTVVNVEIEEYLQRIENDKN